MANDALNDEIKQLIIDTLDLEDIAIDDIVDSEPLFVEGLGLDSIDALEIGVALQKQYGIKLSPEEDDVRQHFASINDLANLVRSQR